MSQDVKKERLIQGVVVSVGMKNTVAVNVEHREQEKFFKKIIKKSKKLLAHDEHEKAKVGNIVLVKEVKPISKKKRHILVDIVR